MALHIYFHVSVFLYIEPFIHPSIYSPTIIRHSFIHRYLCTYFIVHPSICHPYFYRSIHNCILAATVSYLALSFCSSTIYPSMYPPICLLSVHPATSVFFHLLIHPSMLIFTQILIHPLPETHILWLLGHAGSLCCPQALVNHPFTQQMSPLRFPHATCCTRRWWQLGPRQAHLSPHGGYILVCADRQ